ncbi:OmpH family outer membrane protein [Rapidithrix thailandica]|uniref:OmpH family outer membrane protein n=1 Tax=Rapidithrix thailandica TaxID=413964 RepID=A0AAW9RPJ5_9BACT
MKNLSIVLNVVLIIAVGILYVFQFKGNGAGENTAGSAGSDNQSVTVAYVNTDSLIMYYDYYDDISVDFQNKKVKMQKQLESRGRKLESEVVSFQKRAQAGLMSQNDIRSTEQNLLQKQQEFEVYRQTVMSGLVEEEQVLQKQLYERIYNFLEDYNKDKNYDVIFNYVQGSAIWLAEDALDITDEVLKGLNENYKSGKDGGDDSTEETEKKEEAKTEK